MITKHGISKEKRAETIAENERFELLEYCKAQGFTEEQTEIFVRNSLESLNEVYLGE